VSYVVIEYVRGGLVGGASLLCDVARRNQRAGATPQKLFGRLKAEKVGSPPLPPVLVVFRPLLLKFLFRKVLSLSIFGGDRVKTLVKPTLKSEILTFFTENTL
jgi:hypothetical protein